jgi:hypothetical protein
MVSSLGITLLLTQLCQNLGSTDTAKFSLSITAKSRNDFYDLVPIAEFPFGPPCGGTSGAPDFVGLTGGFR